MGLVSDFANGVCEIKKAAEAIRSLASGEGQEIEDASLTELKICGRGGTKVYVYYPAPVSHVMPGQFVWVDVLLDRYKLVSELTGYEETTGRDCVALACDGRIFGTASGYFSMFKRLHDEGFAVKVKATSSGWYAPSYPDMRISVPSQSEVYKWLDKCKEDGEFTDARFD